MTFVNILEAKTQLSKLIQMMLDGEEIIIARNNKPIAELKPYKEKEKKRRAFGVLKDKIKIIGDWEEADKELEELMLNSKLIPDEEDLD